MQMKKKKKTTNSEQLQENKINNNHVENKKINFNNFKFDGKFRIKKELSSFSSHKYLNELIKRYLPKDEDKEFVTSKIINKIINENASSNNIILKNKNVNKND